MGGVGFVLVDLIGSGAGDHGGGLAVDDHPEGVVLAGNGGGLAGVDQSGLDLLPGDHEAAPGGDPPLDRDGRAGLGRLGSGAVSAAQPALPRPR